MNYDLVGLIVGLVTLAIVICASVIVPLARFLRMAKPIRVYFVEDGKREDDTTYEISLPAHGEYSVQIRIIPLLNFRCDLIKFGFIGDEDSRPLPLSVENTFVKDGKRRTESPGTNEDHYIDKKDCYNIHRTREYTSGNNFTVGYRVRTRAPGRYEVRFHLMTDAGHGNALKPLFVNVTALTAEQLYS
jgi:hypothetical protein